MKNWIIGSLIGAIIVFGWQFLSWQVLHLHKGAAKYHPSQDNILSSISSAISEEGAYMLPTTRPGAPMKEHEELIKQMEGKPWASVIFHKQFESRMPMRLVRGFLVDLFLVFTLIYILTRGGVPIPVKVFAGSVAVGLFTFLWGPYMGHNWYDLPMEMIKGDLIDAIAAWGICGLWLGWWLNRK